MEDPMLYAANIPAQDGISEVSLVCLSGGELGPRSKDNYGTYLGQTALTRSF
jgi:hypothetical protein